MKLPVWINTLRDDPRRPPPEEVAYEQGYSDGQSSLWADIALHLDEDGEVSLLKWIRHNLGIEEETHE